MKRIICVTLTLCLLLSIAPLNALAAGSGKLNASITWSLDDSGKLTISGTGPMPDYVTGYTREENSLSWSYRGNWEYMTYADQITSIEIGEGVTSIGQGSFMELRSLTSVHLPKSLRRISPMAFYGCRALSEINVPDALEEIGELAFEFCSKLPAVTLPAKERELLPAVSSNAYASREEPMRSFLYREGNEYVRVENVNKQIVVERYDSSFNLLSARSLENDISSTWGGFFAGASWNFIIIGWTNPQESSASEVIRVLKYSKDWTLVDQLSLYGQNTETPFRSGSVRCAELNGVLWIHTSHRMFQSADGYNHQANLTISIRESNMELLSSRTGVSSIGTGYVSHSFNQYILADREGRLVFFDHGDAYPRAAVLVRKTDSGYANVNVQAFPGATGDNTTGGSLGGLAETGSGYLTAYNYNGVGADSSGIVMGVRTEDPMPTRNIYLGFTSKNNFSASGTTVRKITDYAGNGQYSGGNPVLVAAGLNEGYLIWDVLSRNQSGKYAPTGKLAYVRYAGDGSVSEIRTMDGMLSDCQPIAVDGKAVWYVTYNSEPTFYVLGDDGLMVNHGREKPERYDFEQWNKLLIPGYAVSEDWLEKLCAVLPKTVAVTTNYGTKLRLNVYKWTLDADVGRWNAEIHLEDLPDGMTDPNGVLDRVFLPYAQSSNTGSFLLTKTPVVGKSGGIALRSYRNDSVAAEIYHIIGKTGRYDAVRMPAQTGQKTDALGRIVYETGTDLVYGIDAWRESDAGDWIGIACAPDGTGVFCGAVSVSFCSDDIVNPDDPYKPGDPSDPGGLDDPGRPHTPGETGNYRFDDVKSEKAFYFDAVYWAYDARPQITNGLDKSHFGPTVGCTRGQVVTFLWRAAGCPEPVNRKTAFLDVKQTAFYAEAVAWAVEEGITKGISSWSFAPDATCTRGQIVTFLWRFRNAPTPRSTATGFFDVYSHAFYARAVAWAVEEGITKGMTDTSFAPDATCTRGQIVTFLYRAMTGK